MTFNFLVMCLMFIFFFQEERSEYVDQTTMLLGILLCLQTHVVLFFERKHRDPFIILFTVIIFFYFELRLLTLAYYSYSTVFLRYAFSPADSNFSLLFIIIANMFLYAGLNAVKHRENLQIDSYHWRASSPSRVIFLMAVTTLFTYVSGHYWTTDNIPKVFIFLSLFVTPSIIIMMALCYYLLFRKSLSRKVSFLILFLILLNAMLMTLVGSRSAIIGLIENFILVTLAIVGSIQIRKSVFLFGFVSLPIIMFFLVALFSIATYTRAFKGSAKDNVDLSKNVALALDVNLETALANELIPRMFDRAGFFDFSAEIIAHSERYSSVINIPAYIRSLVDNLLTPGFDIFDQPKISNSLLFVYHERGLPSKQLLSDSYQSDQIGIYGEFYTLFGYASLPLFFIVPFLLKRTYIRLKNKNPFFYAMKRIIILSIFVRMINSFGIDWLFIEFVTFLTAIVVYAYFFQVKSKAVLV